MSSHGIFSSVVESMAPVVSFVLLDQRSEVDHSFISVNVDPVLELMVPTTEHRRLIIILNQPPSMTL